MALNAAAAILPHFIRIPTVEVNLVRTSENHSLALSSYPRVRASMPTEGPRNCIPISFLTVLHGCSSQKAELYGPT